MTQNSEIAIAFAMIIPISGPILKRIRISAANPMTVVSPLDMIEPKDFITAFVIAFVTSASSSRHSAKRWSRKIE